VSDLLRNGQNVGLAAAAGGRVDFVHGHRHVLDGRADVKLDSPQQARPGRQCSYRISRPFTLWNGSSVSVKGQAAVALGGQAAGPALRTAARLRLTLEARQPLHSPAASTLRGDTWQHEWHALSVPGQYPAAQPWV
jgi:hypothetical protein